MRQSYAMSDNEIEHSCYLIERAVTEAIERGVNPSYINWLVSEATGKDEE